MTNSGLTRVGDTIVVGGTPVETPWPVVVTHHINRRGYGDWQLEDVGCGWGGIPLVKSRAVAQLVKYWASHSSIMVLVNTNSVIIHTRKGWRSTGWCPCASLFMRPDGTMNTCLARAALKDEFGLKDFELTSFFKSVMSILKDTTIPVAGGRYAEDADKAKDERNFLYKLRNCKKALIDMNKPAEEEDGYW